MNDLEYLHQISAANRPMASGGGLADGLKSILKSKLMKFAIVGLVLTIGIAVVGSLMGQVGGKEQESLVRVHTRMTNLSATVGSYNQYIKSSKLRAMGATLSGILSETSRDLYSVLTSNYKFEKAPAKIVDEEAARIAQTNDVLDRAKLNGILDRTYLHQLVYEVALLMSLESEAMARSKDAAATTVLTTSMDSLGVLYEQLSNYSDSTN